MAMSIKLNLLHTQTRNGYLWWEGGRGARYYYNIVMLIRALKSSTNHSTCLPDPR